MHDYKEKAIVITGATTGLGSEIIKLLLEEYNVGQVIILDLADRIEKSKKIIHADYISFDLRDVQSIVRAFKIIKERYNKIDVLINNAGVNKLVPALNVSEEIWNEIIDVNLKGTFFVCKEAFSSLVKSKSPCIINIASQFSVVGGKYRCPYAASKSGIIAITKTLALEWAVNGIRVNAISPTICKKENNASLFDLISFRDEYISKIPLNRFCTARDVLESILFLSSEGSSMITGHNLLIDGGWTIP